MSAAVPAPRGTTPSAPDRLEVIFSPTPASASDGALRRHRRQPKPVWRKHPAMTLSVGLIAAAVLRVYVLTYFNFSETMVILRVADRAQLLIGTVTYFALVAIQLLVLALPMLTVTNRYIPQRLTQCIRKYFVFIAIALWTYAAIRTSILTVMPIVALGFFARYVLYPLVRRWFANDKDNTRAIHRVLIFITPLLLAIIGQVATTPASGTERFTLEDGSVIGGVYVMGEENGDIVVMHPDTRLQWVSEDKVVERSICVQLLEKNDPIYKLLAAMHERGFETLAGVLGGKATYPSCT